MARYEKKRYFIFTAYISCNSTPLDTPAQPLDGQWSKVNHVELTGCYPPNPPAIAQSLAVRGARPINIKHLILKEVPPDARFNASHFEGLSAVSTFEMQAAGASPIKQLDSDFLQNLPRVSIIKLENELLSPLQNNSIDSMSVYKGKSLDKWGDCTKLRYLNLRGWSVPKFAGQRGGWLGECKSLSHLNAEHMEMDSLRTVLSGIGASFSLELPRNNLTSSNLRELMESTVDNIEILIAPENNLADLNNVLVTQTKLQKVDISQNFVTDFILLVRALFASRQLRYSIGTLILDYNPIHDFCDWTYSPWLMYTGRQQPLNLQFLSLAGTNITRFCFPDWSLKHLNLSMNNIEDLEFGQLPLFGNIYSVIVDLRQNPLRKVHFNETDYKAFNNIHRPKSEKVTVHTDYLPPFDCDCKNAWLSRALREDLLVLPGGARCHDGSDLRAAPPDSLECDLQPCQPCTCRRNWTSSSVVMHCDNLGLQHIPSIPDIGELHLRGNHIDNIRADNLTSTLTLLDIRDNNISRVDAEAAEALFNVVERRVWLSGNPIACDCDNWPLVTSVQAHHIQVLDYENATCLDGRILSDLTKEQLCSVSKSGLWIWLLAWGGSIAGLLSILGALYTRYDRQLKVWLYAHGWCLNCVREEELDAEREYDAFVSFAHGDDEFVNEQLLPGLENGPHGYKICVHFRDWVPGEMIPTQITRSVTTSRRTIIVLSANFVQSMWGMVEFRAAHVSALAEGRVRVVVVALGNTPGEEQLPEELKMYLRSTTYLRWDDPWFWRKLRYAMPHRADLKTTVVPPKQEAQVRQTAPLSSAFQMMLYEPQ